MAVRKTFGLEHKAQTVDGVFEISLRRSFAALLQQVEIVFDLFGIELSRQRAEVEGYGCNMSAIVIESAGAATKDRNVALKAIE